MNAPNIPPQSRRSPQTLRRRFTDLNRFDRRAPEPILILTEDLDAEPDRILVAPAIERRSSPEPAGSLLIVRHATEDVGSVETAARLAGFHVLQAGTSEEALQVLQEHESRIDLLLVLPHPATPGATTPLIRRALELDPGLHPLMMLDSGRREEMRAGYAAGAASIILHGISTERLTTFLRQSLGAARQGRRRGVQIRERQDRHAADSRARRGVRRFASWMSAPDRSRRGVVRAAFCIGAAALLIGLGLAFTLERYYCAGDEVEAMSRRFLERMNPARASHPDGAAALQRWQVLQQVGLTREANEATRQYYQDHLQELRWQGSSRIGAPPETVAAMPPVPPAIRAR